MKPYGERIPRVHWRENHGCPCCDSYKTLPTKMRKHSKVRERQQGRRIIEQEVGAPNGAEAPIVEFIGEVSAETQGEMDRIEDLRRDLLWHLAGRDTETAAEKKI